MRHLLRSKQVQWTLISLALLGWGLLEFQEWHRQRHSQYQGKFSQAAADQRETASRQQRLARLLALPTDATGLHVAEASEKLILAVRRAESDHWFAVTAMRSMTGAASPGMSAPGQGGGEIVPETMMTTLPDAPGVGRLSFLIEGTFSSMATLEGFLHDTLIPGASLSALKVEGARATIRIDLYGRR